MKKGEMTQERSAERACFWRSEDAVDIGVEVRSGKMQRVEAK